MAAVLLPILKRSDTDAHQPRKVRPVRSLTAFTSGVGTTKRREAFISPLMMARACSKLWRSSLKRVFSKKLSRCRAKSMAQNNHFAENFLGSLPILVPLCWVYSIDLLGTDEGSWLLAVIAILGTECGQLVKEWMKPQPVPYDDPAVWFDRLAETVGCVATVLYLAVALFVVDAPYFTRLKTSLAHFEVSSSAVWVPGLMWAILLANGVYALPLGWRYGRSPRVPGVIVSAVLWIVGAAALILFQAFVPSPNSVLGPNATRAVNFCILWFYLNALCIQATRLGIALRGVGGAARERAQQHVQQVEEDAEWPTGHP